MTPPATAGGLSASAQVVRNVFKSCLISLQDIDQAEVLFIATATASDLVNLIAIQTDDTSATRRSLHEIKMLSTTHIQTIDQSTLPKAANTNA